MTVMPILYTADQNHRAIVSAALKITHLPVENMQHNKSCQPHKNLLSHDIILAEHKGI